MAEKKPATKRSQKSVSSNSVSTKVAQGFTEEEQAAMKERARELKAEARRTRGHKGDGEADVIAKIAEMSEPDRTMATRIHELIKTIAPDLAPRTWYGMPAYANEGKVVCFFQSAQKFKARYSTFGFTDTAKLDDSDMWPTAFALKRLTAEQEAMITALVKKAIS